MIARTTLASLCAVALFSSHAAAAEPLNLSEAGVAGTIPDGWALDYRKPTRPAGFYSYRLSNDRFDAGRGFIELRAGRWPMPIRPERFVEAAAGLIESGLRDMEASMGFRDTYVAQKGQTKVDGMSASFVIAEATPASSPNVRLRLVVLVASDGDRMITATCAVTDLGWDSVWQDYRQLMNSLRVQR